MNNIVNDKKDYGEVILTNDLISLSWWGQMWCRNIENYSNLSNRLSRGRSYIRSNTIKSLIISKNMIETLVQGTLQEPYKVLINIKSINESQYKNILSKCNNSVESLDDLYLGIFPKELQELFTDEKYGLFPRKDEIQFSCTCPDYTDNNHMCKHIAASLYAVGNKLDADPLILFELRGINTDDFLKSVIKYENKYVWNKINEKTDRKIDMQKANALFGVDYNPDYNVDINLEKILESDEDSNLIELSEKNEKENIFLEKNNEMVQSINEYNKNNTNIENYWKCENCKKDNFGNFCTNCGQRKIGLERKRIINFCSRCGNRVGQDHRFCINCGKRLI